MKKVMTSILLILFSIYFIIGLFLFIKQDNFLYFPTQASKSTHTEELFINGDISISTTVLNIGKDRAIIYFGGNAENVDNNILNFSKMFTNHTIYLVKYRGYGSSTGRPTEEGLYSDALYIYDSIKEKYQNISIISRSLGTGVATYLASKRKIDKLALITPFDSVENVAQKKFPIYPMSLLLKHKYKSIERVDKIKAQTLILMAENDQVVNNEHTENLASKFPVSQLNMQVIKGEGHVSISNNRLYYALLKDYFQREISIKTFPTAKPPKVPIK